MQALILAGGEGTRLRPLTLTMPKPAIQLVDRPFLRYMIDWLARHGVDDVVIASGFGADSLRGALDAAGSSAPTVTYVQEPEPLGTGGPLRLAADRGALGERFMVLNGDVLADLDLSALLRAHSERGAVATLALHAVEDPSGYGLVRTGAGGEVVEFTEKPDPGELDSDLISAGAYVMERRVLDLIPPGRMVSLEHEVFPRLVGHGLYGHALDGYWMDIGTPARYLRASWDILEGRVRTDAAERMDAAGLRIEEGAGVDPAATVQPPALLEAEVTIGADAAIGARAVIAADSAIGAAATVSGSVVLAGSIVGAGATITDSILAPGVEIGEGARIGPDVVVGEGVRVDAGAEVGAGARLAPGELVS